MGRPAIPTFCLRMALSLLVVFGLHMVVGCGSSLSASPGSGDISSLSISPAAVTLALNGTQQYTATATYSDGSTANVTSSVTWVSSNPKVVSTASSGMATDLSSSANTVSITATMGSVKSNVSVVTVPQPTLTSLAITPLSVTLALNATQQYAATGSYSDGSTADVTSSVTWASSSPAVVSIGGTGLATDLGSSANAISISATLGSVQSNVSMVTVPAPVLSLKSIAITPASVTLALNGIAAVRCGRYLQRWLYGDHHLLGDLGLFESDNCKYREHRNSDRSGQQRKPHLHYRNVGVDHLKRQCGHCAAGPQVPCDYPGKRDVSAQRNTAIRCDGTYSDNSTANVTSSVTWVSSSPAIVGIGKYRNSDRSGQQRQPHLHHRDLGHDHIQRQSGYCVTGGPQVDCDHPGERQSGTQRTQQYAAVGTYSDGSTANITSFVTWISAAPATVGITNAGLATLLATTTGTSITATYDGITSNVSTGVFSYPHIHCNYAGQHHSRPQRCAAVRSGWHL